MAKLYAEVNGKEKFELPFIYRCRYPLALLSIVIALGGVYEWLTYKGSVVFFYNSGQKQSEGYVKSGEREEKWSFWDEQGNLVQTEEYVNGQLKLKH